MAINTISIFEIIKRANLKREYIKALVKHIDKDAFMMNSTLEAELSTEEFLWNLTILDWETLTRTANELIRQNEPTFEIDGAEYKFFNDSTFTITANGNMVAKGYWMDPTPPLPPAITSAA